MADRALSVASHLDERLTDVHPAMVGEEEVKARNHSKAL
jgi:hypothetical protein